MTLSSIVDVYCYVIISSVHRVYVLLTLCTEFPFALRSPNVEGGSHTPHKGWEGSDTSFCTPANKIRSTAQNDIVTGLRSKRKKHTGSIPGKSRRVFFSLQLINQLRVQPQSINGH
jgi:hypothetical protein